MTMTTMRDLVARIPNEGDVTHLRGYWFKNITPAILSQKHNMCDRCWVEDNTEYDSHGRLASIKEPPPGSECPTRCAVCCWCGWHTFGGVYMRATETRRRLTCGGKHP